MDSDLASLVATAHSNAPSKPQELPAFLIMPIQRLPRYVMLLEDLLRNTPRDHVDFEELTKATPSQASRLAPPHFGASQSLHEVKSVADYVNEKKREAENLNAVIDVQSRLVGLTRNLAEAHRRFVRQGPLLNVVSRRRRARA